jgi:type IV secretion system protein VirD4
MQIFLRASVFLAAYACFALVLATQADKGFSILRAIIGFVIGLFLGIVFMVSLVNSLSVTFRPFIFALFIWGTSGAILFGIKIPFKDLHPVNFTLTRRKVYFLIATTALIMIWFYLMPSLLQAILQSTQIVSWVIGYVAVIVIVVVGFVFLIKKRREPTITKHNADSLAKTSLQDEEIAAIGNSDGVWCGQHDGKNIFVSTQDRGIVIGPPGTGKTSFLITQLLKWIESKRSFVCLDAKPEIHSVLAKRLKELDYNVYVYNPSLESSLRYNPFDDLDSAESIGELASSLIPSPDPRNAVFYENARDFLDAIISHLHEKHEASLPNMREFLKEFNSYRDLFAALCKSPSTDASELANGLAMVGSNERMLGSIFSTLRSNLRFLRYPAIRKSLSASDFSLKALTRRQPAAIFLQFEERHQETTGKLLSSLLGHIMRYLIEHQNRDAVLLLLDEIGNVPLIQGLKEKLNTIRSRKIPTWLYWQNIEQMKKYGQREDGANIILGACDFQMVFRLNDNQSADWISQRIGTVDRIVEARSVQKKGLLNFSVSHSKNIVTEPRIRPHELQQLENGKALCIYRDKSWMASAIPYFELFPEYKTDM